MFTGTLDFDLGEELTIHQLALWSDDRSGPSSLVVRTSDTSSFVTSTVVGTFAPVDFVDFSPTPVQVFDLLDTKARFVRFELDGSHSDRGVALGEVAFDVTPVPLMPSSILLVSALTGFGLWRRLAVAAVDRRTHRLDR